MRPDRRLFLYGSVLMLAAPLAVEAQRVRKVPRVGIMFNECPTSQSTLSSLPR